ncbi:MAG: aminodeoxychorismate/anthranilate synthase component II [Clostridia bacterium]|nr:aminodeoxychorismate/anthranilate synthase component II [Clostridia bacterium]
MKERRIIIVDNYDSFSYNLYQAVGVLDSGVSVIRCDDMPCEEVERRFAPTHIILSPGPGRPEKAGICERTSLYFAGKAAILGVCLGHQAICEAYGAEITYAKRIAHGVRDEIRIDAECPIFEGLGNKIEAARYHSLAARNIPGTLSVTATAADGEIMGVRVKGKEIYGVQFHPESYLTPAGTRVIENFLNLEESGYDG